MKLRIVAAARRQVKRLRLKFRKNLAYLFSPMG